MPTDTSSYESIDSLLAHYLDLLDEYTRLRDALHTLQADMFQHLARANFSAERGVRYYGQDYYDERMQATRRVQIRLRGEGGDVAGKEGSRTGSGSRSESGSGIEESKPLFTIRLHPAPGQEQQEKQEQQEDTTPAERPADRTAAKRDDPASTDASRDASNPDHTSPGETPAASSPNNNNSSNSSDNSNSSRSKTSRKSKSDDPLRWFGILTPPALRQAQAQAIRAVEALR
ncbi:uncharacterized protein THITE_130489, partial [Thermothielavioides terrestris NRRL 8126]